MIARLEGIIVEKESNAIILDVGGVGYRVFVPLRDMSTKQMSDRGRFHIHHHISETASDLYGFESPASLVMFKELIKISSVGPKTALAILSLRSTEEIQRAVMQNNPDMLAGIPGVGKKTVERILVDLKSKIGEMGIASDAPQGENDVFNALVSLGYSRDEAFRALREIPADLATVEERVRASLKILSQ